MVFKPTITTEEIEKLRQAEFPGEIIVINSEGKEYDEAIEYLRSEKIIGFDTETKPCFVAHAARNGVAILQLAGSDRAYVFRVQQLGIPSSLADLLATPQVIKVGAAVRDDINGLQRYRSFEANGFADLQTIAEKFGIEEKSVRKMAAIIVQLRVSKSQQLSNWESARLSEAQLRYAAVDAWICREMYIKLMRS